METLWLTLGTLSFIAATVFFISLMTRAPQGSRHFFIITAAITGVAAFFYLTMTTGATATLVEGRLFYFGRYIDWVITTPLLLLDLALLALPNWRRNIGLIGGLIALDVFMILTGLLAGQSTSEFARGFWFIVSTAALIVLLYLLYTRLFASAQGQPGSVQRIFRTLALLTIVLWSLYPIVWLLGTEGFGVASSTVEVFLFLILDILAKIGFGFLLLTNHEALGQAGGGGATAQASRVR
ncbi:MAG TPA: bacteriorhodopsin [Rubrobacter sp.]|nr:bacteriorhodopsin [Rubrobacter sp.]